MQCRNGHQMVSTAILLHGKHLAVVISLALLTLAVVWGANEGIPLFAGSSGEQVLELLQAIYRTTASCYADASSAESNEPEPLGTSGAVSASGIMQQLGTPSQDQLTSAALAAALLMLMFAVVPGGPRPVLQALATVAALMLCTYCIYWQRLLSKQGEHAACLARCAPWVQRPCTGRGSNSVTCLCLTAWAAGGCVFTCFMQLWRQCAASFSDLLPLHAGHGGSVADRPRAAAGPARDQGSGRQPPAWRLTLTFVKAELVAGQAPGAACHADALVEAGAQL